MISNLELYGTNEVPPVPKEVADERLRLLEERLRTLMNVPMMNQDTYLIGQVIRARDFWTKLRDGENL